MPTARLLSHSAAHGMTGRTLRSSDRDEIDTEIHRIRPLDKASAAPKRLSARSIKPPVSEGLSRDELRANGGGFTAASRQRLVATC